MEFVDFMIPLLGLSRDQIIWTSGESLSIDVDIDLTIQNRIRDIIRSSEGDKAGWVLVPYCVTRGFLNWSTQLCQEFPSSITKALNIEKKESQEKNSKASLEGVTLEVFGETEQWIEKYGNKGILHRHIADLSISSVIEDMDAECQKGLLTTVPKGYQCSSVEHLLEAYRLLKQETHDNRAVIKPITGCAGCGIVFIDTVEELESYDFPMGEVLLEEMLNLDLTVDENVISPAVHYLGTELFGGQLVDQLMKNTSYLGWRESQAPKPFQEKVLEMTEKLMRLTQPKGPGGYDFLSVNGKPVLSDVNTGRFNGAPNPNLNSIY
jgi:hypothetical protein